MAAWASPEPPWANPPVAHGAEPCPPPCRLLPLPITSPTGDVRPLRDAGHFAARGSPAVAPPTPGLTRRDQRSGPADRRGAGRGAPGQRAAGCPCPDPGVLRGRGLVRPGPSLARRPSTILASSPPSSASPGLGGGARRRPVPSWLVLALRAGQRRSAHRDAAGSEPVRPGAHAGADGTAAAEVPVLPAAGRLGGLHPLAARWCSARR